RQRWRDGGNAGSRRAGRSPLGSELSRAVAAARTPHATRSGSARARPPSAARLRKNPKECSNEGLPRIVGTRPEQPWTTRAIARCVVARPRRGTAAHCTLLIRLRSRTALDRRVVRNPVRLYRP